MKLRGTRPASQRVMGDPSVLIVEDDPEVIRALRGAIAGQPIDLEDASTSQAAVRILGQKRFCGIVLDLVLDGGTGFEVLNYLREHQLHVPVVVITQKLPAYVREMLSEELVKLVLPKPVEPRLLATIVMGLCG